MRRLIAFCTLLALTLGAPWGLLTWGYHAWWELTPLAPLDFRVALLTLTAVGWLAWAVFLTAVAVELARVVTKGRLGFDVPGLSLPQGIAAALIAAALAGPASALIPVPSAVAAPSLGRLAVEGVESGSPPVLRAAESTRDADMLVHVVVEGDDLWSLAERYYASGSEWRRIAKANPDLLIDPTADLTPGTALAIVDPADVYTVQRGDTLWAIASRTLGDGSRYPEIQQLNTDQVRDPNHIEVGWGLRLPTRDAAEPRSAAPSSEAPAEAPGVSIAHRGDDQRDPQVDQDADDPVTLPAAPAPAPRGPLPPSPAAPAAQVAESGDPTVRASGDDSGALRLVVGGLGSLAAASLVGVVGLARRRRSNERPVGRHFVEPDDDLAAFEVALRLTSVLGDTSFDRPVLLDRAQRMLHRDVRRADGPPSLRRVVSDQQGVAFEFGEDVDLPDWLGGGRARRGYADWALLEAHPTPDTPAAYPALVSVGHDAAGHAVMLDLAGRGLFAVDAALAVGNGQADPHLTVAALMLELMCSPWVSELDLHVVSADGTLDGVARDQSVRRYASTTAAIAALEEVVAERAEGLRLASGASALLRLDPGLAEPRHPALFVFEPQLDAHDMERIERTLRSGDHGVGVVIPSQAHLAELAPPPPVSPGVVSLGAPDAVEPIEVRLTAHTLDAPVRARVAALHASARSAETLPASWWREHIDAENQEDAVSPTTDATVLPFTRRGPRLDMLGPITLSGATGEEPEKAQRRCLEYLGWLLERPGVTASEMGVALFVTDGTRRSNLSRLRLWLGATPDGKAHLPEAYSGRITLHPAVSSDWRQFQALIAAGINRTPSARLREALELVRGEPLEDAVPGTWAWADALRREIVDTIRDTAACLAESELADGAPERARWAVERGLRAAPADELLGRLLMRSDAALGHLDRVRVTLRSLQRWSDECGVDLADETVALARELLGERQGAPRLVAHGG